MSTQFKSHISQFKSHISQFKTHIGLFMSIISQYKFHISQFKSHGGAGWAGRGKVGRFMGGLRNSSQKWPKGPKALKMGGR